LNPSTPEGQDVLNYMRSQGMPFLGFTGAIPGVATGPHIHAGFPSHRVNQKFGVGAQAKQQPRAQRLTAQTTQKPVDPYFTPDEPEAQQPIQRQTQTQPTPRAVLSAIPGLGAV